MSWGIFLFYWITPLSIGIIRRSVRIENPFCNRPSDLRVDTFSNFSFSIHILNIVTTYTLKKNQIKFAMTVNANHCWSFSTWNRISHQRALLSPLASASHNHLWLSTVKETESDSWKAFHVNAPNFQILNISALEVFSESTQTWILPIIIQKEIQVIHSKRTRFVYLDSKVIQSIRVFRRHYI